MPQGMKLHVKKGDTVLVIAGKDKHRRHQDKVLATEPRTGRVIVEGANIVKQHKKPRGRTPGGIIEKPAPMNASNVMLVCPNCSKPTRTGSHRNDLGQRERICKRCGANVDAK